MSCTVISSGFSSNGIEPIHIADNHLCRGILGAFETHDTEIHVRIGDGLYVAPVGLQGMMAKHVGHVVTFGRFEGVYRLGHAKRWD